MLNATIVSRIDVTKELVRYGVKPDAPFKSFLPGQYVALGLAGSAPRPANFPPEKEPSPAEKLIKRAYSIGSSPEEGDVLEFYIAIVPDGALTSRLVLLNPGDRVYLAPKITGTFTLDGVPPESNLVFVSTGTGLAPFIAMLRTSSTWNPKRRILTLHGVRFPGDLGYRDELEALHVKNRENFQYFPVVSRDDGTSWSGHKGHVQTLFSNGTINLNPATDHVFLCGNPAMIDSVEKLLLPMGYTEHTKKAPGNLHLERYW